MESGGPSVVLNVHEWLSRTTLDAIGEGLSFVFFWCGTVILIEPNLSWVWISVWSSRPRR